ncbi:hypothetical protein V6N13_113844 [Hibiscus sabdariffa]|uniref:Uncharacterized protein n=1 Tax=Hibiscus sabdariffa TaxID=183260 RepID=A0ABR2U0P6_9ROSI
MVGNGGSWFGVLVDLENNVSGGTKLVRDNDVNRMNQGMECDKVTDSRVKVVDNSVKDLVFNVKERLNIATHDTVVNDPSSLMPSKHKAIRVVEGGSKRVMEDNNGHTTYGPIRKTSSKGTNCALPTDVLP